MPEETDLKLALQAQRAQLSKIMELAEKARKEREEAARKKATERSRPGH